MTELIIAYRRAATTASATADAYHAANDARIEAGRAEAHANAAEEDALRLENIAFQSAVAAKQLCISGASEAVFTAVRNFTLAAMQFRSQSHWTHRPDAAYKSAANAAKDSCRTAHTVADALTELEKN